MKALGECAIGDALSVSAGLRIRDAECISELFLAQAIQTAHGADYAENAERRGAVPAKVASGCERESHRDIEPHGRGCDELLPADAAELVGDGKRRAVHEGTRVHATAFIQHVIVVERMARGRVELCRNDGRIALAACKALC